MAKPGFVDRTDQGEQVFAVHGQFVDACCGQAPRKVAVNVVILTESSESCEAGGVSRRNSGRGRSRISRSRFSIKTARQCGSHCSVK